MYVTFTCNGLDIYNTVINPGDSVSRSLSAPVTPGEYSCYISPRTTNRRLESNSLGIYSMFPYHSLSENQLYQCTIDKWN